MHESECPRKLRVLNNGDIQAQRQLNLWALEVIKRKSTGETRLRDHWNCLDPLQRVNGT